MLATVLALCAAPSTPPPRLVPGELELELVARHAAREAPALWEIPDELAGALLGPVAPRLTLVRPLVEVAGGVAGAPPDPIPVQLDPPARAVRWIARDLAAGERRRYVLTWEDADAEPPPARTERDGTLSLAVGERRLAEYAVRPTTPPDGVDAVHARSGYLHPLLTPGGAVVTGDFPSSHRHQHGLMLAWTRTRFEGRALDFWNSAVREGRIEHRALLWSAAGPVFAGLDARLAHVDLTAPDGARDALDETWRVRAFALAGATAVDVESRQRAAGEAPVEVLEYHYGGFAWRGPEAWSGLEGARVRADGAGDRLEGDGARARWVVATGAVDGRACSVVVLASPENFRAPEPVRLHPDEPYFCFAPARLGPFEIGPEEHVARYRVLALDGAPDDEQVRALWDAFAEPPRVTLVARASRRR